MRTNPSKKVFEESFRIVSAFRQQKDSNALRHYVDPILLCQWQEEWDSWVQTTPKFKIEHFEIGRIWMAKNGVVVEFLGSKEEAGKVSEFSVHWTFNKAQDRWVVSQIAPAQEQKYAQAA